MKSTIREALDVPVQLRTSVQKQIAYVIGQWSHPHDCRSCHQSHSVVDCCPPGWTDRTSLPDDLTCPNSKRGVSVVIPLIGDCFLIERRTS